jgi:signal transduction histidine kinase
MLFGWRFFRALRPLIKGMKYMAEKRPVNLSTRGMLSDLAEKINLTSSHLHQQAAALQKRDTARTTWIAGVSHDIRTPLSIVLGYASQLENDQSLSKAQQAQARIIRRRSEEIGALVSDLNLASQLEYSMQPLRKEILFPAELTRSLLAKFLNDGLEEQYSLNLKVINDGQNTTILGDEFLLRRAITNLIENSIRHNPDGCDIQVTVKKEPGSCVISILVMRRLPGNRDRSI